MEDDSGAGSGAELTAISMMALYANLPAKRFYGAMLAVVLLKKNGSTGIGGQDTGHGELRVPLRDTDLDAPSYRAAA